MKRRKKKIRGTLCSLEQTSMQAALQSLLDCVQTHWGPFGLENLRAYASGTVPESNEVEGESLTSVLAWMLHGGGASLASLLHPLPHQDLVRAFEHALVHVEDARDMRLGTCLSRLCLKSPRRHMAHLALGFLCACWDGGAGNDSQEWLPLLSQCMKDTTDDDSLIRVWPVLVDMLTCAAGAAGVAGVAVTPDSSDQVLSCVELVLRPSPRTSSRVVDLAMACAPLLAHKRQLASCALSLGTTRPCHARMARAFLAHPALASHAEAFLQCLLDHWSSEAACTERENLTNQFFLNAFVLWIPAFSAQAAAAVAAAHMNPPCPVPPNEGCCVSLIAQATSMLGSGHHLVEALRNHMARYFAASLIEFVPAAISGMFDTALAHVPALSQRQDMLALVRVIFARVSWVIIHANKDLHYLVLRDHELGGAVAQALFAGLPTISLSPDNLRRFRTIVDQVAPGVDVPTSWAEWSETRKHWVQTVLRSQR